MNLVDLTLEAASAVTHLRKPNLDDWLKAIDPVLEAAGEPSIGRNTIEDIKVSDLTVEICTSYSVRGCDQSTNVRLPVAILIADNPIQAATRYKLSNALTEAKSRLKTAQNAVQLHSAEVEKLEASLAAMA